MRGRIRYLLLGCIVMSLIWAGAMALGSPAALPAGNLQAPVLATLTPIVTDGFTQKPIEGAVVVVPETGKSYVTGKDGKTQPIEVPLIAPTGWRAQLPPDWGEVTLLIYKNGYIDYALFNTHVWADHARSGPEILLFPRDATGMYQPFIVVESPTRAYSEKVLDHYRPR